MIPSEVYSCLLSAKWDWADGPLSGKETGTQQAFMYNPTQMRRVNNVEADYPFKVVDTRLKVKGNGRVVSLRYESEEGKDFELIGHATPFSVETEG